MIGAIVSAWFSGMFFVAMLHAVVGLKDRDEMSKGDAALFAAGWAIAGMSAIMWVVV